MGSWGVAAVGMSSACSRGDVWKDGVAVLCLLEQEALFRQWSPHKLLWFRPWLGVKRWHCAVSLCFSQGSACGVQHLFLLIFVP